MKQTSPLQTPKPQTNGETKASPRDHLPRLVAHACIRLLPAGQRDLLVLAAPAGVLHLPELQQQLPVAAVGGRRGHKGVLHWFPVPDVECRRGSTVSAAEPGAPETGAADQQQPAVPDPPELRATEIRGLSG